MNYWLMKSEPDVFSLEDLARDKKSFWDGVRNYQARNFMRDSMKMGDQVFFYHSNTEIPGIAGLAEVCSEEASPDLTALDPKSSYYDPKATPERVPWVGVWVKFVERFPQVLGLEKLKEIRGLEEMLILRRGNRLSITPVTIEEAKIILSYKNF